MEEEPEGDQEARLSSIISALGFTSLLTLEDFLYSHGTCHVVPVSDQSLPPSQLPSHHKPPTWDQVNELERLLEEKEKVVRGLEIELEVERVRTREFEKRFEGWADQSQFTLAAGVDGRSQQLEAITEREEGTGDGCHDEEMVILHGETRQANSEPAPIASTSALLPSPPPPPPPTLTPQQQTNLSIYPRLLIQYQKELTDLLKNHSWLKSLFNNNSSSIHPIILDKMIKLGSDEVENQRLIKVAKEVGGMEAEKEWRRDWPALDEKLVIGEGVGEEGGERKLSSMEEFESTYQQLQQSFQNIKKLLIDIRDFKDLFIKAQQKIQNDPKNFIQPPISSGMSAVGGNGGEKEKVVMSVRSRRKVVGTGSERKSGTAVGEGKGESVGGEEEERRRSPRKHKTPGGIVEGVFSPRPPKRSQGVDLSFSTTSMALPVPTSTSSALPISTPQPDLDLEPNSSANTIVVPSPSPAASQHLEPEPSPSPPEPSTLDEDSLPRIPSSPVKSPHRPTPTTTTIEVQIPLSPSPKRRKSSASSPPLPIKNKLVAPSSVLHNSSTNNTIKPRVEEDGLGQTLVMSSGRKKKGKLVDLFPELSVKRVKPSPLVRGVGGEGGREVDTPTRLPLGATSTSIPTTSLLQRGPPSPQRAPLASTSTSISTSSPRPPPSAPLIFNSTTTTIPRSQVPPSSASSTFKIFTSPPRLLPSSSSSSTKRFSQTIVVVDEEDFDQPTSAQPQPQPLSPSPNRRTQTRSRSKSRSPSKPFSFSPIGHEEEEEVIERPKQKLKRRVGASNVGMSGLWIDEVGIGTSTFTSGGGEEKEVVHTEEEEVDEEFRIFPMLGMGTPPLPAADWEKIKKREERMKKRVSDVGSGSERKDKDKGKKRKREIEVEAEDADEDTEVFEVERREKKRRRKKKVSDEGEEGDVEGGEMDLEERIRIKEEDVEKGPKEDDPDGQKWMKQVHGIRKLKMDQKRKERNLKKNKLPEIEIDPRKNGGEAHHWKQTVRKKDERAKMVATTCESCKAWYERTGQTAAGRCKHGSSKETEDVQQRVQKSSRHRNPHRQQPDPPGYWQMGFPSTPHVDRMNQEAAAQREEQREYQEMEANNGGFYRYKA